MHYFKKFLVYILIWSTSANEFQTNLLYEKKEIPASSWTVWLISYFTGRLLSGFAAFLWFFSTAAWRSKFSVFFFEDCLSSATFLSLPDFSSFFFSRLPRNESQTVWSKWPFAFQSKSTKRPAKIIFHLCTQRDWAQRWEAHCSAERFPSVSY